MSDKYLLKAMMNRQRFLSLHKSVPRDMFSSITLRVLDSYADYYQKYPEHDEIDVEALSTLMKLKKNQTSEETVVINRVLEGLREDVPEDVLNTTIDYTRLFTCLVLLEFHQGTLSMMRLMLRL